MCFPVCDLDGRFPSTNQRNLLQLPQDIQVLSGHLPNTKLNRHSSPENDYSVPKGSLPFLAQTARRQLTSALKSMTVTVTVNRDGAVMARLRKQCYLGQYDSHLHHQNRESTTNGHCMYATKIQSFKEVPMSNIFPPVKIAESYFNYLIPSPKPEPGIG